MESRGSDIDCLEATELKLGLPGARGTKRAPSKTNAEGIGCGGGAAPPPPKAQLVGWPPVRSFRRNNTFQSAKKAEAAAEAAPGLFVKVSMDGAPYLRKIDLNVYQGYEELRHALQFMFKSFSTGENGSEFAIAYEDKDGDWMLAGDVPWDMFTSSCRRLRIMKGSEANGFAQSM